MSYENYQPSVAPGWLQGPNGAGWLASHGKVKDLIVARLREGIKARMPGEAPSDALDWIAAERGGMERATGESDADFAARLVAAWDSWARAGTPLGILDELAAQKYDSTNGNPGVVQQSGLGFTRDGSGDLVMVTLGTDPQQSGSPPYWTFDQDPTKWNRFAVIFPQASLPATWTDIQASPSDATAPTLEEVNRIRRAIRRMQRASQKCMGIYVGATGRMWGYPTTQKWGAVGAVWGGSVVVWTATP